MSEVLSLHQTVNHAFPLFLCGWEEPEAWRILPVQSPAVMQGRSVAVSVASHCPADPLPLTMSWCSEGHLFFLTYVCSHPGLNKWHAFVQFCG